MTEKSHIDARWFIARKGISLLLNNKIDEAELLFAHHPRSFHIQSGRCFFSFMNALMTFEEDKLQQAVHLLREMEKECAGDTGWLRSMRTRVFGEDPSDESYVDKLDRQVVMADSQVCVALLALLQQELTGYVRSGWMLRKAWRAYQNTYNQILHLYRKTFGNPPSGFQSMCSIPSEVDTNYPSPSSSASSHRPHQLHRSSNTISQSQWSIPSSSSQATTPLNPPTPPASASGLRSSLSMLFSLAGITSEQQTPFIEPSEVSRLMGAVSFGYGIFQLCVSLLPPSLLKLIHIFGFDGDREAGLNALMFARLSEDMRAPFATLALLWYHTIVRPFFALDGANIKAGVEMAKEFINESMPEFENAPLFLFFTGRIERLQSNVNNALVAYKKAVEMSSQREVRLLCLHEVAWCYLICLNYVEAYDSLIKLQDESRWSKSFYAYLASVCAGSDGNIDKLSFSYKRLIYYSTNSTTETQLGQFLSRRTPKLIDQESRAYRFSYYRLLVYEMLYLWNALASCSQEDLRSIANECKHSRNEEPMVGLSDLIEGTCYSYLRDRQAAIRAYRNCLKRRTPAKDVDDQHVSAFVLYELGSILCNGNEAEEGKMLLQRAQSQYKDYDFDNRLSVRIHAALRNSS